VYEWIRVWKLAFVTGREGGVRIKVGTEWKSPPAFLQVFAHCIKIMLPNMLCVFSKHFWSFLCIQLEFNLLTAISPIYAVTSPTITQYTHDTLFLLHSVWASILPEPALWNVFMSDGCFFLPKITAIILWVCVQSLMSRPTLVSCLDNRTVVSRTNKDSKALNANC